MARIIEDAMVETVSQALLGAIDCDGGPTEEQTAVLRAIILGYWGRTDIDVTTLTPLSAKEARGAITQPDQRRRTREFMVLLELCRHPLTATQVDRVEDYCTELGEAEADAGLEVTRDLVRDGIEVAMTDYLRFFEEVASEVSEPTLKEFDGSDESRADLVKQLRAYEDLPAGTLGYEFLEFHRTNNLPLPGEDASHPAVFLAHDMNHLIGGYGTSGQEEIALGAMLLGINDSDAHWINFIGNLAVHEAGFLSSEELVSKTSTLGREGAAELLAEAFRRGSECTGDFSTADHLALASTPLSEVQASFGVPSRV